MSVRYVIEDETFLDDSELGNTFDDVKTVIDEGDDADVRIESHQAGKHDQSKHGKGGGKGRKSYDGSLPVAASDGQRGTPAQQALYAANQKGALGIIVKDRATLISGDAMVDSGGSMQAPETPTSDVEKNFKSHGATRQHQTNQKALNAERISGRMKGDLKELSDSEMEEVAVELKRNAGDGDHFSKKVRIVDPVDRGGVLPDSPGGVQTEDGQFVMKKGGKGVATQADLDRAGENPRAISVAKPGGLGTHRELVSAREAHENDAANALVGMHARTADNGFPPATAVQDSVKAKFGNEFGSPSTSYKTNDGELTGAKAFRAKTGGKMGVTVDSYVDSVYAETQATLKKEGIESFVLHRGTTRGNTTLGSEETYAMNPVSSWSRSNRTANTFGSGETVLTAKVPAKRIWSTASTGPGSFLEEEFIVIGGTIDAHGEEAFGF